MSNKSKGCQGKDIFQRMNFLYQASTLMVDKNKVLSCYYGNLLKSVAKKGVLRIHPDIKRTICKKCGIMLQIGSTAELTLPDNIPKMYNFKCLKCGFLKRYKDNPNYKLWMENPESIVEVFNYSAKKDFEVNKKVAVNEKLEESTPILTKRDRRAIKQKTEKEKDEMIVDEVYMTKLDDSEFKDLMVVDVFENKVILENVEIS